MGGCVSTEEKKRSQEIDRILNGDRKKLREEVKLLLLGMSRRSAVLQLFGGVVVFSDLKPHAPLLGPGESGKSTIFKQMKIIQDNGGFSTDELQSYKYIVYGNCVTQMKVIVNAAMKLDIALDSDENRVCCTSPHSQHARSSRFTCLTPFCCTKTEASRSTY